MYTVTHELLIAKAGEPVRIIFTVTDQNGAAVTLSGASAAYKIARGAGEAAILTKTDSSGITLSGNTATVEFSTGDIKDADSAQLFGEFIGQLKITKSGDGLYVAQGPLLIERVIG